MEDVYIYSTPNSSLANTTTSNVTEFTAPTLPIYLEQPLGATVFQITLWSTIVFLGVIGNLLVCIVILGHPKMKTSMNYYLLSLAIADLGVLLMICPIAVLRYLFPLQWLLGQQACYYLYPTVEVFYGASIWSITAIAIERYRNIVGSKRFQIGYRSRRRTWLVIGMVWLASFLVSSVPLYPFMTYKSTLEICFPDWPDMHGTNAVFLSYSIALFVVLYALPLAIIALTYFKIKRQVRDSVLFRNSMSVNYDNDEAVFSQSSSNKERRNKRIWRQSNKARRILTPLVILFAVTMFPLSTLRIWALIMPKYWTKSYYNLIIGQVVMFIMINSSANPLVYYIMSKEFKEAFKKTLKSLRDKKNFFKQISGKMRSSGKSGSPTVLVAIVSKREENHEQTNNTKNNSNESLAQLVNGNVQIVTGL